MNLMRRLDLPVMLVLLLHAATALAQATRPQQPVVVSTDHADGIYNVGETVRWTIKWNGDAPPTSAHYTLKSGGLKEVGQGELKFSDHVATLETKFDAPNTMLVQVEWEPTDPTHRAVGGAVAAPDNIQPAAPPPEDFDQFWNTKLEESRKLPLNPQLESADGSKPGVSYWKITLDNINGTHVRGQLARPKDGEKFPAMLIPQWAGVYPLQKRWVTDRAADGWLALDIEAHDIPIDNPEDFYKQQYDGPL